MKTWEGLDRNGQDITEIVMHQTAGQKGQTIKGLLKWMENGERTKDYEKSIGLFHYVIGRDGSIYEVVNPDRWVYNSSSGRHDIETIGIEHISETSNNSDEPTAKQYAASVELVKKLIERYPTIKRIVSHDYNGKTYSNRPPKPCPGHFNFNHYLNLGLEIKA